MKNIVEAKKSVSQTIKDKASAAKAKLLYGLAVAPAVVNMKLTTLAAGDDPTAKINNLKGMVINIAEAVGGIVLVFGVVQFGLAWKKGDQQGEHTGVLAVVAGVIIALASGVVDIILR